MEGDHYKLNIRSCYVCARSRVGKDMKWAGGKEDLKQRRSSLEALEPFDLSCVFASSCLANLSKAIFLWQDGAFWSATVAATRKAKALHQVGFQDATQGYLGLRMRDTRPASAQAVDLNFSPGASEDYSNSQLFKLNRCRSCSPQAACISPLESTGLKMYRLPLPAASMLQFCVMGCED